MSSLDRTSPAEPDAAAPPPLYPSGALIQGAEEMSTVLGAADTDPPKMRVGELTALFLAQVTLFMALVVPSAFSLAIKIGALDPGRRDTVLALAIGIAGTLVLFTNPLAGVLSDRTRSRFGRRRPWFLGGVLLGTAGSVVLGLSSSSVVLIAGWCIALAGYSMSAQTVLTYLGDRLPENQRGRVMGISGSLTQVGPILGIVIAGAFSTQLGLIFIVPAAIALVGALWFTAVMKDTRFEGELPVFRLASLARGFYFNPRKHPNFGWVILSKFFVFCYIAFTGLYTVYLLMTRFEMDGAEVSSLVAVTSLGGVPLAILGAIGGGFLSDKFHTRKPFLVISATLLAVSALTIALAPSIPLFVVGGFLASLGIGIYGSVDQALVLDVLPSEENENGRYLSVFGLANAVPQAAGPLLAGLVLSIAGGNYMWVYLVAAGFAVLGALAIIPIRVSRRALLSTTSVKTTT